MLHAILEEEARINADRGGGGGSWNISSYFFGSQGPQVGWTQRTGPSFDWYHDSESGNYINRNTRERINPLTNYRDYQETIEPYLASNYTVETYIPRWSVGTSAIMPDGSTYRGYQEFMGWKKTASNGGNPYTFATIGAIALLADDVTIVGTVDDLAIPLLFAAAVTYDLAKRVYVTYTLTNPSGKKYVGRASGFGDPHSVMIRRYASHHMKSFGYSNPTMDIWAQGAQAYPAIRGREQQMIDFYGGINNVGNSIRGVGYYNPMGRVYHGASNLYFGPLAPYTGF